MTNQELFEMLCTAAFQLLDIYDKHAEELARKGAPEIAFVKLAEERDQVMTELQSCIDFVADKL